MINIPVSEAKLFDELTIASIKQFHLVDSHQEIRHLTTQLTEILGAQRFGEICSSPEFMELYAANEKVYKLMRAAEQEKDTLAARINIQNRERFKAKQALQAKFFNEELLEKKSQPAN